ncbi:HK97 family phage prohead protease [Alteribacillus sp. YIM 98480]|uniref:HK97 family phage prohead protease n=1 Tax=Alteribacillus sp. YIM 98480 TaxID=2606599 RepID=UPI00131CD5DF|nr:HK97 family phage prohead protease [Alteribacillus sp. YIM 98480]
MKKPLELRSAPTQTERRSFDLTKVEVREEGDKKKVRGYAAEFEKLSVRLWGFREKIRKGAFEKSLREGTVKALWNHNTDMVLGSTKNSTLSLWEDDRGLAFELEMPDTSWGRDALSSIERGDVDGVSFGFEVVADEWDHNNPDEAIRTLIDVRLHEISPTPFPAYPQTSVSARSIFYAAGIDYDGVSEAITRSEKGVSLADSDKELIRNTIKILENYAGDEQAGASAEQEAQARSIVQKERELKLLESEVV